MITIFASPKPFKDKHISITQKNAIKSWIEIHPNVQILLIGDEVGLDAISTELNVNLIKGVKKSDIGTPFLSSIIEHAEKNAKFDVMCYINSDIILLDDFYYIVMEITKKVEKFMIIGQRWDVNITEDIKFDSNWKECLINTVKTSGKLHSASGIDFIVFKKYSLKKIPPFIVGRPYWDGWMLWWASWLGLDLIDITLMTKIIHQNHDYSHMGGLKNILNGKEYESNKSLAGNWLFRYNIKYANKILTADGVKNKFKFKSFFIFYRIFLLSISAITMGLSSPLKRYKPYIKSILQYNTRIYKLIFP